MIVLVYAAILLLYGVVVFLVTERSVSNCPQPGSGS